MAFRIVHRFKPLIDDVRASGAGGLQGTAQNLGASLGTALIGSILIASLTTGMLTGITENPDVSPALAQKITSRLENGVPIVSVSQAQDALADAGVPDSQATAIVDEYSDAQVRGLQVALGAIALLALSGFWLSRNLPNTRQTE